MLVRGGAPRRAGISVTEDRDFYVALRRGKRVAYLAGPFPTARDATNVKSRAWQEAENIDPFAHFDICCIAGLPKADSNPKGVLNSKLGLP
jgi:hypothetical protein